MKSNHGAAIFDYSKDGSLFDFSSNINPLGPSEKVIEKIRSNLSNINRYPDYRYRRLYKALEQYLGLDEAYISIGNGAMELIDAVITSYKKILIFNPCFSEYANRAQARDKEILEVNMTEDFKLDYKRIPLKLEDCLVIVTNPNNPTGRSFSEAELNELETIVFERGGALMIDESFFAFSNHTYNSFLRASKHKHLYVISTATKFFSLPGLRLGYMVSCHKKEIDSKILEWSVSSLLEDIGEEMFLDKKFIEESRSYISRERDYLSSKINEIAGFKAYESDANFILVRTDRNVQKVFDFLLERKILVRVCDNYKNLSKNHFRIAVKSHSDNMKLVEALGEYKDE